MLKLTAIGLGPGDPELITVKGVKAIQAADLVFVPRSRGGSESLALRIATPYLESGHQNIVDLPLPMTRNADELVPAWKGAAELMIDAYRQHGAQSGVYLLLGDPLLYGTFIYIWHELIQQHNEMDITIVPGVTSFAAAAAVAQLPLGTTSDRIAVLPASYETDAILLRKFLSDFDTIVLMKAGPVLPRLLLALAELDLLQSAIYAERVGMPEEVVVTDLTKLPGEPAPYLSLLIVTKKDLKRLR